MVVKNLKKIYILGSGISGLSVAERITEKYKHQFEVFLIERNSFVGGLASSFSWGSFPFNDFGPHIWHSPDKKIVDKWKKEFGSLLYEGNFWGENVLGPPPGVFFDYPISLESIKKLNTSERSDVLRELHECTDEKRAKAKNFQEYVEALVGPTLTKKFFLDYPQKLWGIDTSQMTANWAPKRIHLTEKSEKFHREQWAAVGVRGSGTIINKIKDSLLLSGVNFLLNSEVTDLVHKDNRVHQIIINNGSKIINLDPHDIIVSTLPINFFARSLGINNNLEFRGAHLVYLNINQSECIRGKSSFLYFSQKDVIFHRVSEQKKFCNIGWPLNKTHLVAEIAYNESKIDKYNNEDMVTKTIFDLSRYNLLSESKVIETKIVSLPNVYPLLTIDKELEFNRVKSEIQNFQKVYILGTSGGYHYADLQVLYSLGRDLADQIQFEEKENNQGLKLNSNNKKISKDNFDFFTQKPFIIAEVGLNHNGNLNLAIEMLNQCASAGAKFVKFQTYKTENRVSNAYRMGEFTEKITDLEESTFEMFQKCELAEDEWKIIFQHGKKLNLNIFSTPFDLESLKLLESLECPAYKISSMDVNNYPLIKAIAATDKPIILSSGMSSLGEIEKALNILKSGNSKELILLHCVSSYPANLNNLNLNLINTLSNIFNIPVGFSDHSIGLLAPTVALSLGARCIEKHFTHNKYAEGPDHKLSINQEELKILVSIADQIQEIKGSGEKYILRQESEVIHRFKKSIHAKKFIKKGSALNETNLTIKGPGEGLPPEMMEHLLGRIVKRDIDEDNPITWLDI